ncbi:MAG: T9SS type A sorting domain-containing protein [Ignavibacteria bacterium]|nr:T9SS type A sorting domain-containing protein [Ignavibacteria bacterium]
MVFKGTGTPPYLINKNTTDFSANCIFTEQALSKITENDTIVTFGRSGVTSINDIEFIFEIGDIVVGDSIIKFIEVPDTLAYNSANELNQHTRTNNFTLTPATNFYFSNIYHVVQKSNQDTALTATDAVNFKAELVNALTDQVVGTFDNITYNQNNLEKYANIDYEVDCSGITAGEYYLRLITNVNGNANYALANIFNDNTVLAKKNYNKVNFKGSEIPTTYDLAQNFPNPLNPSTTIRYQIPQDEIVTLKIYDILGSEVAKLVNEEKVAGKYEVNINASALASGVYIYKIQAGSFINSKKMILLK